MGNILFHLQFPAPTVTPTMDFQTFFESLDGWEPSEGGGGSAILDTNGVLLSTGATAGGYAAIIQRLTNVPFTLTWDKPRTLELKANITIGNDNAPQVSIMTGNYGSNARKFGFTFFKDSIKGVSGNGSLERVIDLITGLGTGWTATKKYKAIFTPPTDIKFYIDDVLVGTITDRKPTGTTDAGRLLHINLVNGANVQHLLATGYTELTQDL